MEENKVETPKKSNTIIAIILVIVILLGVGLSVWYFALGGKGNNNNKEEEIVEPDSDKQGDKGKVEETVEVELTDGEAKARLNDYLSILTSGSFHLENFLSGKDLTETDMIYFTLHYMFNKEMYRVVTEDTIPDKYQDNSAFAKAYLDVEAILEVNIDKFKETYKELFGKNVKVTLDNIKDANTSPCIGIVDNELKVMYFNNAACGEGISPNSFPATVKKITTTNNNYYVYFTVAKRVLGTESKDGFYKISNDTKVDVTELKGNEDKFDTLRWTFNKNYLFVESRLTPTESPFVR